MQFLDAFANFLGPSIAAKPPIDELTKKANGNKYILSIIASKRAKEIETTRRAELATADKKSISIALDEIAEGKIVPSDIND